MSTGEIGLSGKVIVVTGGSRGIGIGGFTNSSAGTPAKRRCSRSRHGASCTTNTSRSLRGAASPRTMLPDTTTPSGS